MNPNDLVKNKQETAPWEYICSTDGSEWGMITINHIYDQIDSMPISRAEKKELLLKILEKLLGDGSIVFEDPDLPEGSTVFRSWKADKETIIQTIDKNWPDLNDPDYDEKVLIYFHSGYYIAWIDRSGETDPQGRLGSLWIDGMKIAGPGEW